MFFATLGRQQTRKKCGKIHNHHVLYAIYGKKTSVVTYCV